MARCEVCENEYDKTFEVIDRETEGKPRVPAEAGKKDKARRPGVAGGRAPSTIPRPARRAPG